MAELREGVGWGEPRLMAMEERSEAAQGPYDRLYEVEQVVIPFARRVGQPHDEFNMAVWAIVP